MRQPSAMASDILIDLSGARPAVSHVTANALSSDTNPEPAGRFQKRIPCDVILPLDHVRFVAIKAGAEDPVAEAIAKIAAESSFDPKGLIGTELLSEDANTGPRVAVVAKETLQEAVGLSHRLGYAPQYFTIKSTPNATEFDPLFAVPPRSGARYGYALMSVAAVLVALGGLTQVNFDRFSQVIETSAQASETADAFPLSGSQNLPTGTAELLAPLGYERNGFESAEFQIQLAALDTTTGRITTESGVGVLNRRPSITPPARQLPASVPRPKLRPNKSAPVEVETTTPDPVETGVPEVIPAPAPSEAVEAPAPETVPNVETTQTPDTDFDGPRPKLRPAALTKAEEPVATQGFKPISEAVEDEATTVLGAPEIAEEAVQEPQETVLAYPGHQGKLPKSRPDNLSIQRKVDLTALAYPGHRGKKSKPRPSGLKSKIAKLTEPQQPEPEVAPSLTKIQIAEDIAKRQAEAELEAQRSAALDLAKAKEAQRQQLLEAARLRPPSARYVPGKKPSSFTGTIARTKSNIRKASLTTPAATQPKAKAPSASKTSKSTKKERGPSSTFKKSALSLVGVYGTSATRRALMRTSSGRYVKVKQGQRVGGWRISAIGESSIKITKGSRAKTLRLP